VKIVLMGSGGVGKSCIAIQYTRGEFVRAYDPTIEESYRKTLEIDDTCYMLEIIDTAGTEQFTAMRDLYIKSGQGFMLVFSLISDSTFHDIEILRKQIIKAKEQQDVPMLLVGNKADITEKRAVTAEDAQAMADSSFSGRYFETSAKTGQNINKVFEDLTRQVVEKLPKGRGGSRSKCNLL